MGCINRGATFWAFFKNHDAPVLNALIGHQLTLKRPSDPPKNRRRQFPKPKLAQNLTFLDCQIDSVDFFGGPKAFLELVDVQ